MFIKLRRTGRQWQWVGREHAFNPSAEAGESL